MDIKVCKYYKFGRKCTNPQKFDCMDNVNGTCQSNLYYSIELERKIKRLEWYLNEIRDEELKSLDVDWDEYEIGCETTDYSNIINLVEEALGEVDYKDCRYRLQEVE